MTFPSSNRQCREHDLWGCLTILERGFTYFTLIISAVPSLSGKWLWVLREKGEFPEGKKKVSKLGRDLQTALCHLMVCELITGAKLPSKRSLFGKVKFHLCSKKLRARQRREKMMVSVARLAALPAGWLFGKILEDVLWGMVMCVIFHDWSQRI